MNKNNTVIYHMQRKGEYVATVVTLPNGKCVVSWPTSTIVYDSEANARAVHIAHMGGRGEPTSFHLIHASEAFSRGYVVCYQDDCENVPFGSGPIPPDYVKSDDRSEYYKGYVAQASNLYTHDWRVVTRNWAVKPGKYHPDFNEATKDTE
jgi:hypothetical protein